MRLKNAVAKLLPLAVFNVITLAAPVIALLGVMLLAASAFAQAPGAPAADGDWSGLLKAMLDGVQSGNWWLAAGPALTLVVWVLRKYDLLIPKVGPAIDGFLNQPLVAFALPVVLSALTGLFSALGTGQPIGPALLAAVKVAGAAMMTFLLAKNVSEQADRAGAKAAAAVTSGPAAVDVINKP